ncbi:MAG TPA: hypothetical protein PKM15_04760, partial [bacterium]|nr:hypothetical protein [bacterium]
MRSFVKGVFLSLAFILLFVSCGETGKKDTGKPEGSEGGPCYGNKTCDDGLVCEDGVCVDSEKVTDKDTGDTADDGNSGDSGDTGGDDFSNSSECVGDVWAGDFVLTDQDDVAEIAKYVAVTGNFYVKDSDFVNVELSSDWLLLL